MKSSKPSAITAAPSSSIGAGLAGSGRHHHGARSLDAHRPEGRPLTCRRDGSLLTHRWREMDSNFRFRARRSSLSGDRGFESGFLQQ